MIQALFNKSTANSSSEVNLLNSNIKRLVIGLFVFILLSLVFTNETLKQAHNKFFCVLAEPIVNNINPHIYTEIIPEAPENKKAQWETTIIVYDKRKHGNKIKDPKRRKQVSPSSKMYKSLRDIVLTPFLLFCSLIFASNLNWKSKLLKWFLGVLIFYVFISLYISSRLEYLMNENTLPIDSIWHFIITIFGFNGSIEPIYFYVIFIWAILVLPSTLNLRQSKISE